MLVEQLAYPLPDNLADFCFGLAGVYYHPPFRFIGCQLDITLPHLLVKGYIFLLKAVWLSGALAGKPFFWRYIQQNCQVRFKSVGYSLVNKRLKVILESISLFLSRAKYYSN